MITETGNSPKDIMRYAFEVAQNSTCARRRVGAVIVDQNGAVISTGWNHSANGKSCEAKFFQEWLERNGHEITPEIQLHIGLLMKDAALAHECEKHLNKELSLLWRDFKSYTQTPEFKKEHWDFMQQEVHSEVHAVLNALKEGKSVANCILYSSRSPCIDCAKAMIEAGIVKCYYTEVSEKGLSGGLALLDEVIEVEHLDISGDD